MTDCVGSVVDYQANLLNEIYGFSNSQTEQPQALKIYQDNLLMTATRSLSITYPVIEKMLGSEALLVLGRRLLNFERPDSGDWADWGSSLAEILEQSELDEAFPFLKDVARLEWFLQRASRCPTTIFVAESLPLLEKSDLNRVFMQLHPSIALVESAYPLEELWRIHHSLATEEEPDNEVLERVMSTRKSRSYCVVGQKDLSPQVTSLNENEFLWMQGVSEGLSVAALLDEYPGFDFALWLSTSIKNNWLLRFY